MYYSPPSSDAFLARVATEKRISLIKAWEESEKAKAENKLVLPLFQIMKCSYYGFSKKKMFLLHFNLHTYRVNGSHIIP